MSYTLRPYQQEAVDGFVRYFQKHQGNPILALPTGAGKSVILAEIIRLALSYGSRCLVTTHVKELVDQDAQKLESMLPPGTVGVNSAGLGRRDYTQPVICAGIQSVHRAADRMGTFDLMFVDECQLVPQQRTGRYRELIADLMAANPCLKVVGLTATPFRMRGGWLHAGAHRVFTHIAHSVDVVRLIDEGWLAPLVSKRPTSGEIDTTGVPIVGGEFQRAGLEAIVGEQARVDAAVQEIVERGADRRSWLVFACSVKHANQVTDALRERGASAEIVTGDTPTADRDRLIADFREGRIRCLVNVNVLTTGFDAPQIDLLAVLRPTRSPVLYVQMMGRGMRTAPGKTDCLVLDFGGNVARHGPVNSIEIHEGGPPEAGVGVAPTKECPECASMLHAALRECPDCGFQFPAPEVKHEVRASNEDIIQRSGTEEVAVSHASYGRHKGRGGRPDSVKVTYLCDGLQTHSEWLCFDHGGNAAKIARNWWRERSPGTEAPRSVSEALERCQDGEPRMPAALRLEHGTGRFPTIRARIG